MALRELQTLNRTHVQDALKFKYGGVIPKSGRDKSKDEPKEWRPWIRMYQWERKEAYKTLNVSLTSSSSQPQNSLSLTNPLSPIFSYFEN